MTWVLTPRTQDGRKVAMTVYSNVRRKLSKIIREDSWNLNMDSKNSSSQDEIKSNEYRGYFRNTRINDHFVVLANNLTTVNRRFNLQSFTSFSVNIGISFDTTRCAYDVLSHETTPLSTTCFLTTRDKLIRGLKFHRESGNTIQNCRHCKIK